MEIRRTDGFVGPDQVHAGSAAGFVWVYEDDQPPQVMSRKAQSVHGLSEAVEVRPLDQNTDIPRGAGGAGVDAADPTGYRISPDDSVADAGCVEGCGHSPEPFFDAIDRHHMSPEGKCFHRRDCNAGRLGGSISRDRQTAGGDAGRCESVIDGCSLPV
ncbi:MAG: hypothetical protein ACYS7M_05225, partial [Planctomycetota bacterium]